MSKSAMLHEKVLVHFDFCFHFSQIFQLPLVKLHLHLSTTTLFLILHLVSLHCCMLIQM